MLLHRHVREPVALVRQQHHRDAGLGEVPHRGFEATQATTMPVGPVAVEDRNVSSQAVRPSGRNVVICASEARREQLATVERIAPRW